MRLAAAILCLLSGAAHADDASEAWQCAALAHWAQLLGDEQRLSELGYRLALPQANELLRNRKRGDNPIPNFASDRSADFWAGMWYDRAFLMVQDWLQDQVPVRSRSGGDATQKMMTMTKQAQLWGPIAYREYYERGCPLQSLK